jgi:hypothetical protein
MGLKVSVKGDRSSVMSPSNHLENHLEKDNFTSVVEMQKTLDRDFQSCSNLPIFARIQLNI